MRKHSLKGLIAGMAIAFFAFACSQEEEAVAPAPEQDGSINGVPAEVVEQFRSLAFDVSDINIEGDNYLLEGDILISEKQLQEMLAQKDDPNAEHCYTSLVSAPRTINVQPVGYNSTEIAALDQAISRLNSLGLTITFRRVSSGGNIIARRECCYAGGRAGFPSGGNPYPEFYIGTALSPYGVTVTSHVIQHEIGHCIGLRHTDWFNRAYSCGSGGSEPLNPPGCNVIPGVPQYVYDPGSFMNACFNLGSNGNISSLDRQALQWMY